MRCFAYACAIPVRIAMRMHRIGRPVAGRLAMETDLVTLARRAMLIALALLAVMVPAVRADDTQTPTVVIPADQVHDVTTGGTPPAATATNVNVTVVINSPGAVVNNVQVAAATAAPAAPTPPTPPQVTAPTPPTPPQVTAPTPPTPPAAPQVTAPAPPAPPAAPAATSSAAAPSAPNGPAAAPSTDAPVAAASTPAPAPQPAVAPPSGARGGATLQAAPRHAHHRTTAPLGVVAAAVPVVATAAAASAPTLAFVAPSPPRHHHAAATASAPRDRAVPAAQPSTPSLPTPIGTPSAAAGVGGPGGGGTALALALVAALLLTGSAGPPERVALLRRRLPLRAGGRLERPG
jgi:hypothetical protein